MEECCLAFKLYGFIIYFIRNQCICLLLLTYKIYSTKCRSYLNGFTNMLSALMNIGSLEIWKVNDFKGLDFKIFLYLFCTSVWWMQSYGIRRQWCHWSDVRGRLMDCIVAVSSTVWLQWTIFYKDGSHFRASWFRSKRSRNHVPGVDVNNC